MLQVAASVGMTEEKAPLLMSVYMLSCLVFSIPAGLVVEKASTKRVLALSAGLAAIGSGLGAYLGNASGLLASRGLEGMGFVLMCIAIPVAVTKYTDPKNLGVVMGACSIWVSLGSIFALNTVPALSRSYNWQGIWWIYAGMTLAIVAVFYVLFGVDPDRVEGAQSSASREDVPQRSFKEAFQNKNLLLPSIGFLTFNFNMMAMFTFFPVFAQSSGLMDVGKASFLASFPMILSLVSAPVFGRLSDKVGHKSLYMLTILGGGVGVALMFVKSMAVIWIGAITLGLVGTATPSLIFSSVGKLIPSHDLIAKSNGIVVLLQNAGLFLSSSLFGGLVRSFGNSYTKAGLMLIPLAIVSAALVSRAKYNE